MEVDTSVWGFLHVRECCKVIVPVLYIYHFSF